MTLAFAELEGVELFSFDDGKFCSLLDSESEIAFYRVSHNVSYKPYNPITDLALNCAARDKYKVEVIYSQLYVCDESCAGYTEIDSLDDVNQAVIECILKSKGKWHEQ